MDISGVLFNGLPPYHSPTAKIIGAEFDGHCIARAEEDAVSTHVSAEIRVDFVVLVVLQVTSERPAFEHLQDGGALIDSHYLPPINCAFFTITGCEKRLDFPAIDHIR